MAFHLHEVLHIGAEAIVGKGEWLGREAVQKQRRPRAWRHPALDERLGKRRMVAEARLLIRLKKLGMHVPEVWDIDFTTGQLVIEFLNGTTLIELLNRSTRVPSEIEQILKKVGYSVRLLHRQAITHGDLSTNNIMLVNGEVFLIDFGLASIEYETERFGIDLHVLDEILRASHPDWEGAIEFVLDGYRECETIEGSAPVLQGGSVPSANEVIERLEMVRSRVRYHT